MKQQVRARLGDTLSPAPQCEEALCAACMDAPKGHAGHAVPALVRMACWWEVRQASPNTRGRWTNEEPIENLRVNSTHAAAHFLRR